MRPVKSILVEPSCLGDAEGPYEDVQPAFTELKAMGIQLHVATDPAETLYITDNAEGLAKARTAGMIPILLMHDPDKAMRLTAENPAGGIVSLLELPDLIRFVSAQATTPLPSPLHAAP
jgi:FMN phosphatase YigB (HAD superfamily)